METKIFNGKKIIIRKFSRKDLKNVKKFHDFVDSLIEEGVFINANKKKSSREELERIKEQLQEIKKKKRVSLVAELNNKVIGSTGIDLNWGRQGHVGNVGISIRNGYRQIGLGTYLMKEIIKLAKKELKPKPKIIRLSVMPINKPALKLYKKFGFKKVAKIPNQL